jgi:hypothetical protein
MNKAALLSQFALFFFLAGLPDLFAADAKLVEGARREGKLVWWGTLNLDVSKRMLDQFEKNIRSSRPSCFARDAGRC